VFTSIIVWWAPPDRHMSHSNVNAFWSERGFRCSSRTSVRYTVAELTVVTYNVIHTERHTKCRDMYTHTRMRTHTHAHSHTHTHRQTQTHVVQYTRLWTQTVYNNCLVLPSIAHLHPISFFALTRNFVWEPGVNLCITLCCFSLPQYTSLYSEPYQWQN